MIILDTNVISEVVRQRPEPRVLVRLGRMPVADLRLCATVRAELAAGVALLDLGRRRQRLDAALNAFIAELSSDVLPFDSRCAELYGEVMATRQRQGHRIEPMDAQIAAICQHHRAALATRNVDDFAGLGLDIINPWDD